MNKLITYGSLLIILATAFFFRTNNAYHEVFHDSGEVQLIGIDPYFYLRHVETTFRNYPNLQKWDHGAHFPNGSTGDAAGLHVVLMAGICKLLLPESASDDHIASVIAWVAPVLSVIAFLLVFLIVRQLRNSMAGLAATFMLLLVPGKSLPRGLLGFPDHHVFELVFSLLFLMAINYVIRLTDRTTSIVKLILAGIPIGLFFTIWSGAPLYLVLLLGIMVAYGAVVDYTREEGILLSKRSFIFLLSSFLTYSSIYILWPDLITLANEGYQSDVLVILGGLTLAIPMIIYCLQSKSKYSFAGSKVMLMILISTIALILLKYTSYGGTFMNYLNFSFQGIVENEVITNQSFLKYTGFMGIASYIFGIVYLFYSVFNQSRSNTIPLIAISLFLTFFWYRTYDLGYLVNPFMAMMVAIAIYDLSRYFFNDRQVANAPLIGGAVLMSLLPRLLIPISPYNYSATEISKSIKYITPYKEAMVWLRQNTPVPNPKTTDILQKRLASTNAEDYGIMTSWDLGNLVVQKAQRKPVWSRWPSAVTAAWFANTDELDAINTICHDCTGGQHIKYVIIDAAMASSYFVANYNLIGKDIKDCIIQENVVINNVDYTVPGLGDCYMQSMAYKLYVEQGSGLQYFEKIYESEHRSLVATKVSNNQLNLSNWSEDELNPGSLDQITDGMTFNLGNDVYTNCALRPSIMIFEVLDTLKRDASKLTE